jgi:hypothetical protein
MQLTEIHPLINGLVRELPAPGAPMVGKQDWLACAASILALLYPETQPSLAAKTGPGQAPSPAAPGAVERAEPPERPVHDQAAPEPYSPERAFDAGGPTPLADRDRGETQVQVLPVEVEILGKGGPTGMGRSDSGESTASTAGEVGLASSPAPVTLMDRIRAAYALHPGWTAREFVAAMPGTKFNSVSSMLTTVRKEQNTVPGEPGEQGADAPEASDGGKNENRLIHGDGEGVDAALPKRRVRSSLKGHVLAGARADVLDAHTTNSNRTISGAAEQLGMNRSAVAVISRELGIRWSKKHEPAAEPNAAAEVAGEVHAKGSSPVTNVLPFSDVVRKPMQRAPRGKKFRLTDGEGNYLHFTCRQMVKGTKNTWEGTESQLAACRRTFPLARDLFERAIEKVASHV